MQSTHVLVALKKRPYLHSLDSYGRPSNKVASGDESRGLPRMIFHLSLRQLVGGESLLSVQRPSAQSHQVSLAVASRQNRKCVSGEGFKHMVVKRTLLCIQLKQSEAA